MKAQTGKDDTNIFVLMKHRIPQKYNMKLFASSQNVVKKKYYIGT